MNLASKVLGSVVRWALAGIGGSVLGWLVAKGAIDAALAREVLEWLTGSVTAQVVTFILSVVVPLMWSYRRNLFELLHLRKAADLRAGVPLETVRAEVRLDQREKSVASRYLPFLVLGVMLIFTGCVSSHSGQNVDAWTTRAQRLVIDATDAYDVTMTLIGTAYRSEAKRCIDASTFTDPSGGALLVDQPKLTGCMKTANLTRDRVIAGANAYRTTAKAVLAAKSWLDVVLKIDELRVAAAEIVAAYRAIGSNSETVARTLDAPLDAALKGGAL